MFNLIRSRTLAHSVTSSRACRNFSMVYYHPFSSRTIKSIATYENQDSFVVSYLVNSCGLSPEKANSSSKRLNFKTPENADLVLDFFKNHGFSKTQIINLIKVNPTCLLSDPVKTLLPKFEFFQSIGLSREDIARAISSYPSILNHSLQKRIIPAFNLCRNLVQSDERALTAVKRYVGVLDYKLERFVVPNIRILRDAGVRESDINYILVNQPRVIMKNSYLFEKAVEEVIGMGFNTSSIFFVVAVHYLRSMSKSTWNRKVQLYKTWGWSEEEVYNAFKVFPGCMSASENKITAVMDFVVNKVGLESSVVARQPMIISFSLKNRIVPRGSVYQVMLEKGMINDNCSFLSLLSYPEGKFIRKITKCCKEDAPELLKLYQEKLELS